MKNISLARRLWRVLAPSKNKFAPVPKNPSAPSSSFEALERLIAWFHGDEAPPQVLYLGDSVLERVSRNDDDKTPLGQMLCDDLPDSISSRWLSHSAYQSRVYLHLLRSVLAMRHQPRLVILPINLRSFVPQWNLNPEWRFDSEIAILEEYAKNPTGAKFPLQRTVPTPAELAAFAATRCEYSHTDLKTIGDFQCLIASQPDSPEAREERRKQIFVYHAMFPLQAEHEKLICWRDIAQLLQDSGISALFYVTPVNCQAGARHLGNDFVKTTKANAQVVASTLAPFSGNKAFAFHDFSDSFGSDAFFHADEPTEHLCAAGRKRLATLLCRPAIDLMSCG